MEGGKDEIERKEEKGRGRKKKMRGGGKKHIKMKQGSELKKFLRPNKGKKNQLHNHIQLPWMLIHPTI